jgi:hypothetical protein
MPRAGYAYILQHLIVDLAEQIDVDVVGLEGVGVLDEDPSLPATRGPRSYRELLQQRIRLLQNRRIEAFRKPVVDWREEAARLRPPTLIAPEAGEAGGGAQLKSFCALVSGDSQCAMKAALSPAVITNRIQKIALDPMQVGLPDAFFSCLDELRPLFCFTQALSGLAEYCANLSEARKVKCLKCDGPGGCNQRESFSQQRDSLACFSKHC